MLIDQIRRTFHHWILKAERFIPVSKRYIMFESELDFSESPRAIYNYMIQHQMNKKYHLIWSVQDPTLYPSEKNVVFIRRNNQSIKWNFYLNCCRYFIFSHPYWLDNWKSSQCVINTDHVTISMKGPDLKRITPIRFDFILAGTSEAEGFKRAFWINCGDFGIARLDLPRNDWLFERKPELDTLWGKKVFDKIILCMPTFKAARGWIDGEDNSPFLINTINSNEELNSLNTLLGKKNTLLICKIHHLQVLDNKDISPMSNILYLQDADLYSKNCMINHLLAIADALVTDFSSAAIDFLLLDRPIGYFCDGVDRYTRGYLMDNPEEYMPGERIYSFSDLEAFIDNVCSGVDSFRSSRANVRDRCFGFSDNHNCERFLEYFAIQ